MSSKRRGSIWRKWLYTWNSVLSVYQKHLEALVSYRLLPSARTCEIRNSCEFLLLTSFRCRLPCQFWSGSHHPPPPAISAKAWSKNEELVRRQTGGGFAKVCVGKSWRDCWDSRRLGRRGCPCSLENHIVQLGLWKHQKGQAGAQRHPQESRGVNWGEAQWESSIGSPSKISWGGVFKISPCLSCTPDQANQTWVSWRRPELWTSEHSLHYSF